MQPVFYDESHRSPKIILSKVAKYLPAKYSKNFEQNTSEEERMSRAVQLNHKEEESMETVEDNDDNTVFTGRANLKQLSWKTWFKDLEHLLRTIIQCFCSYN